MAIYNFKCRQCDKQIERISKIGDEKIICPLCRGLCDRIHGRDIPSPAQIDYGVGGVDKPRFGKRKYG